MEDEIYLSWEVGQMTEARSFEHGFRGAWFRCKIIEDGNTTGRNGRVRLKYYDFIDDKPTLLKLYQLAPSKKHKELMLRPCYPPIYNAKEMPHASAISEVSVIFYDSWKVGDLVDWMKDGCYWSGTITQLLGDGKAEIELKPPPHGEGGVYVAELKDVRPSLDWFPEYGWTMPKKEGDSGRPTAWLLQPIKQDAGEPKNMNTHREAKAVRDEINSAETKDTKNLFSAPRRAKKIQRKRTREDCHDSETESGKTTTEHKSNAADEDNLDSGRSMESDEDRVGLTLNSARFDTLEAAVLDLEECLNKVKWFKMILESEILSRDDKRRQWEFVEPLAGHQLPK